MIKHNPWTIGIAIGSFVFGTQILQLISKIRTGQNFTFEAVVGLIGFVLAGVSLYFTYPYKNK